MIVHWSRGQGLYVWRTYLISLLGMLYQKKKKVCGYNYKLLFPIVLEAKEFTVKVPANMVSRDIHSLVYKQQSSVALLGKELHIYGI